MKQVKRLEIVIEAIEKDTVVEILKRNKIDHYTLYKNVEGCGERGTRDDHVFGEKFENITFVVACEENQLQPVVEDIRLLLKKYGGICLVSDAMWVLH